jgi:hypothetical protein
MPAATDARVDRHGHLTGAPHHGYVRLVMKAQEAKATGSRSLAERLDRLAAFLPMFEDREFRLGLWVGGRPLPHGMLHVPEFVLSDPAVALVEAAYDAGWVLADFDWASWKNSAEARELTRDPQALARATHEQLAKLLTVLIRQDRFVDGTLAEAFDSGLLVAILRRADALRREGPSDVG